MAAVDSGLQRAESLVGLAERPQPGAASAAGQLRRRGDRSVGPAAGRRAVRYAAGAGAAALDRAGHTQSVRVTDPLHQRLDTALRLAEKAAAMAMAMRPAPGSGRGALKGWQDWVTEADRAIERFLSDALAAAFPADGFQGEEGGVSRGGSLRWVIDPIDGHLQLRPRRHPVLHLDRLPGRRHASYRRDRRADGGGDDQRAARAGGLSERPADPGGRNNRSEAGDHGGRLVPPPARLPSI